MQILYATGIIISTDIILNQLKRSGAQNTNSVSDL